MLIDEKWLSVKQVCEILNVSKSTVHRLVGSDDLLAVQVPTQLRIAESSVERYLREKLSDPQERMTS